MFDWAEMTIAASLILALSGWIAARSIHLISDNGYSAAKTTKAIKPLLVESALKKDQAISKSVISWTTLYLQVIQ